MINKGSLEISGSQSSEIDYDSSPDNLANTPTMNSVYKKYDDLTDSFKGKENLESVIDDCLFEIEKKGDWKAYFELLEQLRVLNKYHYPTLHTKIAGLTDFIIQNIESLRSNLTKEALLLLKEILPSSKQKELPKEFISKIVPILCDKAVCEKRFINTEAKGAVKELEMYCAGDAAVQALSLKCFDKSGAVCEFSFQALCNLVKNPGDDIRNKLSLEGWKVLLKCLLKVLEGRRAAMKKQGEALWNHLKGVLEKEGDIEIFLETKVGLTKKEISTLMQIKMTEKKATPKSNIQSFIKEQKMLIESSPVNINRNHMKAFAHNEIADKEIPKKEPTYDDDDEI